MAGPGRFAPLGLTLPYGLTVLLGAGAYFALARLGLTLASLHESASPVWPASGFALALLVVYGRRCWPAVALGAFAANALTGGVLTAIPITIGNTLEGLVGLMIYERVMRVNQEQLPIARSVALVGAALVAPLLSAGTGVSTLVISGALDATLAGDVFVTWWAGDALGILLVTPFLQAWRQRPGQPVDLSADALTRLFILVAAALAISALAFLLPNWGAAIFLVLPVVLLAARWFRFFGASLVVLVTAAAWLAGTLEGFGPFIEPLLNASLINMQIMLAALAVAGLVLPEVLRDTPAAADAVYLVGSGLAAFIFLIVSANNTAVDRRHFDNLVQRINANIHDRMGLYVSSLQGGASLYAASRDVRRAEWRSYVQSLDIFTRHPGIKAIGIVTPADPTARASFVAAARRDGMPDFDIRKVPNIPADAAAYPQHFVIIYSEPYQENRAAVGLDIASEPNRRNTAIAARDSGEPKITPRITLVQTGTPGFLLFVPMYREPRDTLNSASLRWSFHGWVYAAFAADQFFGPSIIGDNPELRLQVFDGDRPITSDLIYDSGRNPETGKAATHFVVQAESKLALYGRTFTLRWQQAPGFLAQSRGVPVLFGAGLVIFGTLLAALIATLMSQRERAFAIARQMNAALTASNERFELAVACSRDGMWDYDVTTGQVWRSPRYTEMYGYTEADVTGDHWDFWRRVVHPEDAAPAQAQYEEMMTGKRDGLDLIKRYRHRDGHIMHVHSRALAVRDSSGKVTRVIGIHDDITQLVQLELRLKAAINVMPDGFGLFDADDRLIMFNQAFFDEGTRQVYTDPTGCTFEEVVRAFVEYDMPEAKDPSFDREAWIAQRMERHRNPPKEPIEVRWGGGRWMRISERRTADGGYVGIWTDVTEIKRLGQRLQDAIDALGDGFALFDAEDKLVAHNYHFLAESARRRYGKDATGATFEELYRLYATEDLGIKDPAEIENYMQARLRLHRNPPPKPYEVMTEDGGHHRIVERRTSDGGTVGIWSDVTTERQAQNRLRDAIGALTDGFALFDADDRLVICNKGFGSAKTRAHFGDIIGRTYEEIYRVYGKYDLGLRGDLLEDWLRQRLAVHNDPPDGPYEATSPDGRIYRVVEKRTSDGGSVGTWSDVTEERLAQRRLQDAINSMSDGFALFDSEDRLVIYNDGFMSESLRYSFGDPTGKTFEEIYRVFAERDPVMTNSADRDAWLQRRLELHRNPPPDPYEFVGSDGRYTRILERRTSDGGTVGIWSDVTAVRVAERRLADAIDTINEGFILVDAQGRYALFNEEFLRLYPKTAGFVKLGGSFQESLRVGALAGEYASITTPAEVEAFVDEWWSRFQEPSGFQVEGAFADGRWVLINHHGMADGGFVNVYTDITAMKNREQDLALAKQRLEDQAATLRTLAGELEIAKVAAERANISKSNFLANMSHELRTPLNGILGFAEIIKEGIFGEVQPEQYKGYADDIFKSGKHLMTLINDVLDLSKIEAERMTLSVDAIETASVVAQALRLVENLAAERGVRLETPDIARCPVLHADATQVRQILLNLLSNAVKFTPDGGSVALSADEDGENGVVIRIKDSGIGMTQAEIKRAMERFGQAEASFSKSMSGTGLGLPLVDGLVKLHGGTLTIESVKGEGTTIIVRLPWHDGLYRQSASDNAAQ